MKLPAQIMKSTGWVPDLPDKRDRVYAVAPPSGREVPDDYRMKCPPVYDQLRVGSCVWNAIGAAAEITMIRRDMDDPVKKGKPYCHKPWTPSRLFGYFNTRALEGTVMVDAGCQLRTAMKVGARFGLVPESQWQYEEKHVFTRPPIEVYTHARKHQILDYAKVPQTESGIKNCVMDDHPVAFGAALYTSFLTKEVAATGIVPMPLQSESSAGGHAMLIVGWCNETKRWRVRNSWNETWGDHGYALIPYDYLLDPDFAASFWMVRFVEREDGERPPMAA